MRRWLLLLLLVVLPLQFATAAAASYCRHEAGVAKHFGHHEHEHEASRGKASSPLDAGATDGNDDDSDNADGNRADGNNVDGNSTGGDSDCEYCHLGTSHPLLQDLVRAGDGGTAIPTTRPVPSLGSRDPDALDRPNWVALA